MTKLRDPHPAFPGLHSRWARDGSVRHQRYRPRTARLSLLRWPLLYMALLCALACLYRYGPSRTRPQWKWVTWGSALAGAVWLIGSLILSWYVANFGSYNATYGSLGAVIGFLIWMWLSTIIVLGGAEINAEMENQTARDTP